MSIDSLGIHLGPLYLRFYGLILVSGAMIAGYLASVEARRKGHDPNHVWDGLIWALIGGIVGARLYHVFTPPPSMIALGITTEAYFKDPIKILEVWNGGLGIPGGIIGGVIGLWLYTYRAKLDFLTWVDIAAPALPLAQAIGRWGNFVNQELYGKPSDLPWAIYIAPPYRLPAYTDAERFHPTFFYESVLTFLICLALLHVARRYADRIKPGDLFLIYLVLYPTVRFFIEFLRLDSSGFGNLNINQTLSALVALACVVVLAVRNRRQRRVKAAAA